MEKFKELIIKNKSGIILGVIVILVLVTITAKQVIETNQLSAKEVEVSNVYKLYNFGSEVCPACVKAKPVYEKLKEEYSNKMNFEYVDANTNNELTTKYKIQYTPTFIIVDENGKMVDQLIGFESESAFRRFVLAWVK